MLLKATVVDYDFEKDDYSTWRLSIEGLPQVVRCGNTEMQFEGARFIGEAVPGTLRLEFSKSELVEKDREPSFEVIPSHGEGDSAVMVGSFDTYDLRRRLYVVKSLIEVSATMELQSPAPAFHFQDNVRVFGTMYFEPSEDWLRQ